jgi:hypothetical protein
MKLVKVRPLGLIYSIKPTNIIIARIGIVRSRVLLVITN